jgi:hypothetical protein
MASMSGSKLPSNRTFVVQMSAEASPSEGSFAGRAERLESGRVSHFASREALIRFVNGVLAEDEGVRAISATLQPGTAR